MEQVIVSIMEASRLGELIGLSTIPLMVEQKPF